MEKLISNLNRSFIPMQTSRIKWKQPSINSYAKKSELSPQITCFDNAHINTLSLDSNELLKSTKLDMFNQSYYLDPFEDQDDLDDDDFCNVISYPLKDSFSTIFDERLDS